MARTCRFRNHASDIHQFKPLHWSGRFWITNPSTSAAPHSLLLRPTSAQTRMQKSWKCEMFGCSSWKVLFTFLPLWFWNWWMSNLMNREWDDWIDIEWNQLLNVSDDISLKFCAKSRFFKEYPSGTFALYLMNDWYMVQDHVDYENCRTVPFLLFQMDWFVS
jgi:hypothetical protein